MVLTLIPVASASCCCVIAKWGIFSAKTALEKAKAKYEEEKASLAELVKLRNELRKEELMTAVLNSSKNYEEILAFVKGKREDE